MPTENTYALLDFGNQRRLEQWGPHRLIRPDPTATGAPASPEIWQDADAVFEGEKGKGAWNVRRTMPEYWDVPFNDMQLRVRLAPYKHTGVFPEQQANWQWCRERSAGQRIKVLNLFAYTGGASVALAVDGHAVTHVDASKPAITWAKENTELNGVDNHIRWILDDAPAFAAKERKRGKRYDAVILDPPAYGHSPSGKTWRVERDLAPLLEDCVVLLSDNPAFLVLNGYAQHDTPESFHRLLSGIFHTHLPQRVPSITAAELLLHAADGRTLSTGITARCAF